MVPVVDLSRRGARWAARFGSECERIVASGSILLGHETAAFEREFAAWVGSTDAVAVSSGAAALQLALTSIGVGPGDEVIVPAFTAVPTASAVCAVGAVPVLVDVEADTANLDPALVESARTERTKAVVVVHLYGLRGTLPTTDLAIVEDAAQAHGAVGDGAGSTAVAYSFYPTKNLGGIGDGGAVVMRDPDQTALVRRLRVHGMTELYVHTSISQNFRMSEIEAAWLRIGLETLTADTARRHAIATAYREAAPRLRWQSTSPSHAYHLCVVRTSDRARFRESLAAAGIATGVHYPLAITQQPAFAQFGRQRCPEAEAWAAECVSLPCFAEMTDDEVALVADALAAVTAGEA